MSLHDILMSRAAIHFKNEQGGAFTGIGLNDLWSTVGESIAKKQEEMKAQRDAEEQSRKAIETYGKLSGGGKLIPSLKMKSDGSFETTASTPSPSEEKSQYELNIEKNFQNDIESGIDEQTLRRKYATKGKEIDDAVQNNIIPRGLPQISGVSQSIKIPNGQVSTIPSQKILNSNDIKYIPKIDGLGRIIGYDIDKPSSAQETRNVETQELSDKLQGITKLFVKARKEASSVDNFGKSGIEGRVAGVEAVMKGKIGDSPAINVFTDNVDAFATTTSKAAGEVRPTDEDIKRFSKAMISMYKNDAENALQLGVVLDDIRAKGHSISWAAPLIREFERETGTKVDFDFSDMMIGGYKVRVR